MGFKRAVGWSGSAVVRRSSGVVLAASLALVLVLLLAGSALGATGTVMLASSTAAGVSANNNAINTTISGNGRYVAFVSNATNLVTPATANQQIFRKDMMTGAVALVSCNTAGVQGNGNSNSVAVSYDGRYVTFASDSTNLVSPATANIQVFRKDLVSGEVLLVSTSAAGTEGNGNSNVGSISYDGRFVAFASLSTNLVTPATANMQVYRKDLLTGALYLCSATTGGAQGNGNSAQPSITADGRFVAFATDATNLATPATSVISVFRKDAETGAIILISESATGVRGNAQSFMPGISPDGSHVVFASAATNLVTPATANQQIFLKNAASGQVRLVSCNAAGTAGNNASTFPSVSTGGAYAIFSSISTNLVSPAPAVAQQVYRKDMASGTVAVASSKSSGELGDGGSITNLSTGISATGRFVAFASNSTDLVTPATAGMQSYRKELQVSFFFAEGTCRPGFEPYLTIQNPGAAAANTKVTYMLGDGTNEEQTLSVPAHSRSTITVKQVLGEGDDAAHDFSCKVECTNGQTIIAERPMYFNYKPGQLNWNGGTDVVGATSPSTVFFFAEGTCRPGFDPYLTIQNPGGVAAEVGITYMKGDGTTTDQTLTVPAHARSTVTVKQTLGQGDDAAHDFSCRLISSNGQPIVAERPMYFNYRPGQLNWNGGSDVIGALVPSTAFYFAEGTCRPGFEPYLTIQNPGAEAANVTITYMKGDGANIADTMVVPAHARSTVTVAQTLGQGDDAAHDFSCKVECTNGQTIIAERPMYFNYKPGQLNWNGGDDVIGVLSPATAFYFAEGTCRPGFDPYLTIQNPGSTAASITITYMRGDGTTEEQNLSVPSHSRSTVTVKQILGEGNDAAHDFSCAVVSTNRMGIIVERPMYFNYKPGVLNWTGGTDVPGLVF